MNHIKAKKKRKLRKSAVNVNQQMFVSEGSIVCVENVGSSSFWFHVDHLVSCWQQQGSVFL